VQLEENVAPWLKSEKEKQSNRAINGCRSMELHESNISVIYEIKMNLIRPNNNNNSNNIK